MYSCFLCSTCKFFCFFLDPWKDLEKPLNFVFQNWYEPGTVSTVCMIKKNYNRSSKQTANVCHTSVLVTVLKDMIITTSPTAVILLILYIKHALLWDCFVLGGFPFQHLPVILQWGGIHFFFTDNNRNITETTQSCQKEDMSHIIPSLLFFSLFLHLYRRYNILSLHMISSQSATEPVMNS